MTEHPGFGKGVGSGHHEFFGYGYGKGGGRGDTHDTGMGFGDGKGKGPGGPIGSEAHFTSRKEWIDVLVLKCNGPTSPALAPFIQAQLDYWSTQ